VNTKPTLALLFALAGLAPAGPNESPQQPGAPAAIPSQTAAAIAGACKVSDAGDDPAKLGNAAACVENMRQALQIQSRIGTELNSQPMAEVIRRKCKVDQAGSDLKKLSDAEACVERYATAIAANPSASVAIVKVDCKYNEAEGDPKKLKAAEACVAMQTEVLVAQNQINSILRNMSSPDAVRQSCRVDEAGEDLKKLSKAKTCVQQKKTAEDAANAFKQSIKKNLAVVETIGPPTAVVNLASSEQVQPLPTPVQSTASGGEAPQQVVQPPGFQQPSPPPAAGAHIGGSVYYTPSTCVMTGKTPDNGASITSPLIGVRRELLAPKEASDVYGRRLGKRYVIYQVRVSDYSKDFQFVVHDISLNLKDILLRTNAIPKDTNKQGPPSAYLGSSRDLAVLRGIPEKGMDYDPRNLSLHILTGIGSVAGGVSGLTAFSDVMGSAVSVFNGAFLQAFVGIFPDHTPSQLNRLSDDAFTSNSLVDKLHTKVFAIFIPQSLVLDKADQGTFWSDPRTLITKYPLDQVDVCVDGSLVTEVSITPSPSFSISDTKVAPGTQISITDQDSNAAIYFTQVDGTTPTASTDDKYTGPITLPTTIGDSKTVRAMAVSPNQQPSPIVAQTYVIDRVPSASPAAGKVTFPANVKLTPAVTGDDLYYTTDGKTTPTTNSTKYSATGIPITAPTTLKVIEVPSSGAAGPVATFDYNSK
jgi:hypothetical protein